MIFLPARRRAAAAMAALASLALLSAPGAASAAWTQKDDPIGLEGVAENVSENKEATLVLYCGKGGGHRPTFVLSAAAITAYGDPRPGLITLVGPEGSGPHDDNGDPTRERIEIDGMVHSRGDAAFFVADSVSAGLYHEAFSKWSDFEIAVGRTRYQFTGERKKKVTETIASCLFWWRAQ